MVSSVGYNRIQPSSPGASGARFGRGPTDDEFAQLEASLKQHHLETDRLERLNVRVQENPDKAISRWLYRVLGKPLDWIRGVMGHLKHWSDDKKPYDIRWAKLESSEKAQWWGDSWAGEAADRNYEFAEDKDPVRYQVIRNAPDDQSVLQILIHDPEKFKKGGYLNLGKDNKS